MSKCNQDSIIPSKPVIQYHEFKCYRCHYNNRFVKPEAFIDYKKEFEIQLKLKNRMIHELNSLMEFSDRNYGLNPYKDNLIEALTKLRDRYS